ncbi:fucose 4-O-acetylase-like acetyltransferase [Diaminobutyricimonas aerilata]|uniref:Fucose 4-O-acetylase-like acetyltransferase n=1 Tax=Diaminobutyricimonas aerilata TaxID=1162967 RepID=A0A2M9CLL8_9MICO|nr:acyltransferase family protein [Diaminobutyricimonas aerilata]PJJ72769.1 fucose 4-O-acetylase-like acetyltransferase [Diaminobutyricimonas aerilata]
MTTTLPEGAAAAAQRRVPLWDNARFVCVTLVVIGHAIQRQISDSDNALIVYLFVYAWHMPAFAIISGYFSKSGAPNGRQMKKVLTDILLPYLIMETIWTSVQFLVEGKREFNPTQPSWTLWFLLALGIFRLILPYLALIRWPLFWAVALSIGAGYFDNIDTTFSLSRAIGILPFFVLGWKVREWGLVEKYRLMDAQAWWLRLAAVVVGAAWLVVVVAYLPFWRQIELRYWFFYDRSYVGIGEDQWWGGIVRLAVIALAVLLSACFLVLIPRGETWMTGFGQATMYIYLLHSFVLYPIRETGLLKDAHATNVWLLSMVFASIAISIALASPLVRRVFRPIIEPKPDWLFVDRDAGRTSKVDPTGSRRRG